MTFDEWMKANNPKYSKSDDTVELRLLRGTWDAATLAEREACRQECLQVLEESNNIAASVCAGRIALR